MADVQPNDGAKCPKTLNTVWHGAFAFVRREYGIEVLTPRESVHANYAGTWEIGGLHKLADGGRYKLLGAVAAPPAARFDPKYNIFVDGPLAGDVDRLVHSSWMLPPPKEIFTLQRITIQESNFTGTKPAGIHIPHEFGAVQVLTFELDGSVPSVEGLPGWIPEGREIVNLHVFAEEVTGFTTSSVLQHPKSEFQSLLRLTRLGERTDLNFDYTPTEIPLVQSCGEGLDGLRRKELVSLAANGLLGKDDPDVEAARDSVDSGALVGHPCAGIIGGGG